MKISLNWINDYVDIKNEDKKILADKITNAGVNIEDIKQYNFNNLVVGQITHCEKHPGSDHLNICQVNVGDKTQQIICGADNVTEGIKVIVSLPGAILPQDFLIEERTLMGVKSCGMICALYELDLADKELTYNDGIHILQEDAVVGDDATKYLGVDDTIYSLDLNPNRNDCLSHLGFAYEVGCVLNKKITMPTTNHNEEKESINDTLKLQINTPNCYMYQTKIVTDVKVKESPDFIKKRLEAVGMRSINNVVDISNYIMLEYGQPLHFFDKDKVGNEIIVTMATDDEKITTIDEQEQQLTKDDIIIKNNKEPIAIAGVMGGLNTQIDENTKNIIIESAIFNPYNVRYTSIRLGLRSEASLRFEKTLCYEYTNLALERACHLLEKYADAKVLKDTIIYDKIEKNPKEVEITTDKINNVLGITIPTNDIEEILNRLEFKYIKQNDTYKITIPTRRMDVSIKEDIIEEIGRLYGYDKIDNKTPVLPIKPGSYTGNIKVRKNISKRLRSLSLDEVKTYTLVGQKEIEMFNQKDSIKLLMPMSNDKAYIRQSIIPSLLNVYSYNKSRNINDINIYEISNVYDKEYNEKTLLSILMSGQYIKNNFQNKGITTDFYVIKGILENLFNFLGFEKRIRYVALKDINELHPGISAEIYIDNDKVGYVGKVNPKVTNDDIFVAELDLSIIFTKKSKKIKYPEISKYPEIKKDIAFILDNKILASDVEKEIRKNGSKLLTNIEIFDLYKGDNIENNKKSLAFSLTFQDNNKTLTDEEVDQVFKNIIDKVSQKFNCEIRDK